MLAKVPLYFRGVKLRQLFSEAIPLGLIATSVLVLWKSLMLLTACEAPIVVVLTGSMEPGFCRGDLLFLHMSTAPVRTGEVVVFKLEGRDVPIVHRVIQVHHRTDGSHIDIRTKGDNNRLDDRALYGNGTQWLHQQHIMGRVVGYLPKVGMVTIIMKDWPYLKYGLIGVLGWLMLKEKGARG